MDFLEIQHVCCLFHIYNIITRYTINSTCINSGDASDVNSFYLRTMIMMLMISVPCDPSPGKILGQRYFVVLW